MLVIRCTRKLLSRLRAPVADTVPPSNTILGDWYANLLFTRPIQLVLFVSERSLLPVIVPAKDSQAVMERFREGLAEILHAIGVSQPAIDRELVAAGTYAFAPTASRSVLGSINDFAWHAKCLFDERPLLTLHEIALQLADIPCSPLQYLKPAEVTRALLNRRD